MNPLSPPGVEPLEPFESHKPLTIERICERELKNRGWKLAVEPALLADGKTFVQRVRDRVMNYCVAENLACSEQIVVKAVRTEYGVLLHRAVSLHGHATQSTALEETSREGWKVALYKCNGNKEEAESALYSALLKLWQHIGSVRPESYFEYFIKVLIREIQQLWRRNRGGGGNVPLGATHPGREDAANPEEWDDNLADDGATGEGAYQSVLNNLGLSSVVEALRKCLRNPRWTFVVISNFVLELNASEIAAQLKTTANAVHQIKFKALQHIREHCGQTLLAELRA